MVCRLVEHDGVELFITDGSVALEDPGLYDCINCGLQKCSCGDGAYRETDMPNFSDEEWAELERIYSLSDEEANAELLALGIDPVEFEKRGLEFVAQLKKEKANVQV